MAVKNRRKIRASRAGSCRLAFVVLLLAVLAAGTAFGQAGSLPADAGSSFDSQATDAGVPRAGLDPGGGYDSPAPRSLIVLIMKIIFFIIIGLVCLYLVRHWFFTLNRLLGRQRHPYVDITQADWPSVTVLVPSHNEEKVIADMLTAMLEVDYPHDLLRVIPINDRSEDRTGEIMDEFAKKNPELITPFHRKDGLAGKSAALNDAMELVDDRIILVFDADYIPGRGLIKQLVAPFFDPEVGAVMGRVVPLNVGKNLLTRSLDMERSGGYQVDQQARMNMHLVTQYGGTVGGIRLSALEAVGGWNLYSLAEDTDVTIRLLLKGWKTVYQNRSECYEQVPENWKGRMAQIYRWARGHNQVLQAYGWRVWTSPHLRFAEKVDATFLLNVYLMSVILLLGWILGIILWYLAALKSSLLIILAVTSYSTLGNFATFFEIAAANHLDRSHNRVRLLPLIMLGFLVSLMTITKATLTQFMSWRRNKKVLWHKTERTTRRTQWE